MRPRNTKAIIFVTTLSLMATISHAAPVPITFDIDPTRSQVRWDITLIVGTSTFPLTDAAPNSTTAIIDGFLVGTFDDQTNVLSIDTPRGHIVQPDNKTFQPSFAIGERSSIGALINVGFASGPASARDVLYGTEFVIDSFAADELSVGDTGFIPVLPAEHSMQGIMDYMITGLFSASGTTPFSIGGTTTVDRVSGFYKRLDRNTVELTIDIDNRVGITVVQFSPQIVVNAEFFVRGRAVSVAQIVPETSSLLLGSTPIVALAAQFARRRRQ